MHDPAKKVKNRKREAYSVESLKMTSHAFNKMSNRAGGPWPDLRAQALHSLSTLCFFAVARMRDLCGAKAQEYSTRTTLLERDVTLMKDNGQVVGLQVHFRSEKIAKEYGLALGHGLGESRRRNNSPYAKPRNLVESGSPFVEVGPRHIE